jgi:kynurenine formamidase
MKELVTSLARARVFDLGRQLEASTPVSPSHPPFRMALLRRHGDSVRADGMSGANELITLGGHTGTHIDALAHVSSHGQLHGGIDAQAASSGGRFRELGVETVAPLIGRGVLLDVPAARGCETLEPSHRIDDRELAETARLQRTEPEAGDVVLIRTGWPVGRYASNGAYVGHDTGVPGPDISAARWLSKQGIKAAGADTIAFEWLAPGAGHSLLPVHTHLLYEAGIYILEVLDLEELAAEGVHEFVFIAVPLKLVGATGSPIRPLALVP